MKIKLPLHEFETTEEDYNFLQKIADNQLFKFIGENLSYWRWNNLLKMSEKIKNKCEKLGYEPKKVSPKFLIDLSFTISPKFQDFPFKLCFNSIKKTDGEYLI